MNPQISFRRESDAPRGLVMRSPQDVVMRDAGARFGVQVSAMIVRVMAGLVVDDLPVAKRWYAKAFGREPDAEPMDGLLEWHLSESGWLQVVDLAVIRTIQEMPRWGAAGASSVSFVIDDLAAQLARFEANGVPLGPQHTTPDFNTATVRDPFGNLVTFVEARKPSS